MQDNNQFNPGLRRAGDSPPPGGGVPLPPGEATPEATRIRELFEHQLALGNWLSFCRHPRVRVLGRPNRAHPGHRFSGLVVCLALLLGIPGALSAAPAQQTNTQSHLDYSSFKLINERNIFNTRRSPRYVPTDRRESRRSRSESFALVGTMKYEKGLFAFFDGTRSDYRKVLKQDDTIAGFKVAAIDPSYVKLVSPTNEMELHVGKQLRREEEGEWRLSDRPEVLEPSVASSAPRPSASSATRLAPESTVLQGGGGQAILAEGASPADLAVAGDPQNEVIGTNSPPAAATGGNDPESILERLRQRRERENP